MLHNKITLIATAELNKCHYTNMEGLGFVLGLGIP